MNRIRRIWIPGFAIMAIAACGGNKNATYLYESGNAGTETASEITVVAKDDVAAEPEQPIVPEERIIVADKKIIRDGRMNLEVGNLPAAKQGIDTLIRRLGGYYASESFSEYSYEKSWQLTIRIPSSNFDKLIAEIEAGEGKVTYKALYIRDVTEQYTDIEIRLTNKRTYLKRYRELVAKANTVKDVLDIEERIRGLEEEIESAEGRLRLLSDLIAYSTLELSVTTPTEYKFTPSPQHKFWERLKASVVGGWRGIVSFMLGLLYLWPFFVIAGVILFAWLRRRRRRIRNRRNG